MRSPTQTTAISRRPSALMDIDRLGFRLLPMLFEAGEAYVKELDDSRAAAKERERLERERGEAQATGKKRKRAGDSLREKDPW